jgi:hypothetical protein
MSMTWLDAVDTIRKARNKAAGKPLRTTPGSTSGVRVTSVSSASCSMAPRS